MSFSVSPLSPLVREVVIISIAYCEDMSSEIAAQYSRYMGGTCTNVSSLKVGMRSSPMTCSNAGRLAAALQLIKRSSRNMGALMTQRKCSGIPKTHCTAITASEILLRALEHVNAAIRHTAAFALAALGTVYKGA